MCSAHSIFEGFVFCLCVRNQVLILACTGHGKGLLQTSEREVNEIRQSRLQDELQGIRTGETVFLDAGSLTFSQSIFIEVGNITIRGRGRQETTIRCPDEGDTTAFILR